LVEIVKETLMSEETRKVLEMLAEGKINASDAERLLDKLSLTQDPFTANEPATAAAPSAPANPKKFLRVLIERPGGNDVNVRVPLIFIRSGVKLNGVLPPQILAKLQEEGIDPQLFSGKSEDALNQLHVDMETKSGKHVRVFCE
jgi:hypothetical protein